jgi:glycerophosphoryl diester phosphodiesterase
MKPINFAHRGASGYCPENTMIAFKKAIQLGATGIETDVQMTKDGHLVLIHDESLKRTTTSKKGMVKDFTLSELKQLDAGRWFHSRFRGEAVPTLEELIDLVSGTSIILNLELKNGIVPYPTMEERVIQYVKLYGMTNRVVISSFNHNSLIRCKEISEDVSTGLLYSGPIAGIGEYAKNLGVNSLHPKKSLVTESLIEHAHAHGLRVFPWTVNRISEMKKLIRLRSDGLITDYPDRMNNLL